MITHIPRSGPIRLDGRSVSPEQAVDRIRSLVRRLRRPTPRQLDVAVDHPGVVQAVTAWARSHLAPCEVAGDVVRVVLLPIRFGEPPWATLRELEAGALPWDDVTEIGGRIAGASA